MLGTVSTSLLWFFNLVSLAAWLTPRSYTTKAQRIINILVGLVMRFIVFQLTKEGAAHAHTLLN